MEMGDDECFVAEQPLTKSGSGMPLKGDGGPGYGWVGDIRLDLPLDEDDYLMPSQQTSASASVHPQQSYMELTDDKGWQDCISFETNHQVYCKGLVQC